MSGLFTAGTAVLGAGVGLGCGWLAVYLERVEGLEEEEAEERSAAEEAHRLEGERASAAGEPDPEPLLWKPERYGWTWLERVAAPALGALGFGCFAAHEGAVRTLPIHLLWIAVFVHVTVFDVKHRLILDRITYPAVPLALVLAPVSPGLSIWTALAGALAVCAFFAVQSILLGGTVLGLGDAKLGALVGATTGLGADLDHLGALDAVIAAVLAAGVTALLLLVLRVRGLRDPIPYGPFLCAGAALVIYHGPAGP